MSFSRQHLQQEALPATVMCLLLNAVLGRAWVYPVRALVNILLAFEITINCSWLSCSRPAACHNTACLIMCLQKERWDGAWVGQQAGQQVFKADVVHNVMEVRADDTC